MKIMFFLMNFSKNNPPQNIGKWQLSYLGKKTTLIFSSTTEWKTQWWNATCQRAQCYKSTVTRPVTGLIQQLCSRLTQMSSRWQQLKHVKQSANRDANIRRDTTMPSSPSHRREGRCWHVRRRRVLKLLKYYARFNFIDTLQLSTPPWIKNM